MPARNLIRPTLVLMALAAMLLGSFADAKAGEVLVLDRNQNAVYRYTETGTLIGLLFEDDTNLDSSTGIQVSPDGTKLYVSSANDGHVAIYDYDYANATATFSTTVGGLGFPNSVLFNPAGDKYYVSDFATGNVYQFNSSDNSSTGAAINGGTNASATGMAWSPAGELIVGGFNGMVSKSNGAITSLSDFITGPSGEYGGASGVLRIGNDLYVSAMFVDRVYRFDATTGTLDAGFNVALPAFSFPQALMASPDGNGILLGVLAGGYIAHFGFDGTQLPNWANSTPNGFAEPTAFVHVPEPSTLLLAGIALAAFGFAAKRRRGARG